MPKNTHITCRVPNELAERARRKAERLDATLSSALRRLLAEWVRGESATVETAREIHALRVELLALGRNLNQITRAVNQGLAPESFAIQATKLTHVLRRLFTVLEPYGLRPTRRNDDPAPESAG